MTDMTPLQAAIKEHGVRIHPVYVDSHEGAPFGERDHDIYDVLLVIETDRNLYNQPRNLRKNTLLVKGFHQPPRDSLRQNGNKLVPPTAEYVLERLLTEASYTNYGSAQEWATDFQFTGDADGEWARFQATRKDLESFLSFAYAQFEDALSS